QQCDPVSSARRILCGGNKCERDRYRSQPDVTMMRRRTLNSKPSGEEGVVIILVAVVMLFVVTAMAAIAIDLVTFYTARSEAQQAADAAALAGARAMASSGMTSVTALDPMVAFAEVQAKAIAVQTGLQNKVGGSAPTVTADINYTQPGNPYIT